MKNLDVIAAVLLVIGGLNWGTIGLFNFDLVATLFSGIPAIQNSIYMVVGLAALYQGLGWKRIQMRWSTPERAKVLS